MSLVMKNLELLAFEHVKISFDNKITFEKLNPRSIY